MGKKILVGMLLLGALIVFALATFYIENWQVYLKEGYLIKARFPTAQGLVKGDQVQIAGVEVGRIDSLEVDTTGNAQMPVTISMWIEKGARVRSSDTAQVEVRSIFGGAFMSIQPGDPAAPELKPGEELANTKVQPNITQLMAKADDALDEVASAFDGAGEAVENIRRITAKLSTGEESSLGMLLNSRDAYDKLETTMASAKGAFDGIEGITTDVREGKGLLAKLVTDEQLAKEAEALVTDARELAANLKKVSADLEAGKGTAGKLFKDQTLYDELSTTVTEARSAFAGLEDFAKQAREGKGLVAKLLSDEGLATDLEQIAANVKNFSDTLGKLADKMETSTVGRLMSDDEAYKKLVAVMDNLNSAASSLADKQGTLGMLVKDRKLYDQLTGAAESVQKLLDDYREQSPVLTFAGAIFSAF